MLRHWRLFGVYGCTNIMGAGCIWLRIIIARICEHVAWRQVACACVHSDKVKYMHNVRVLGHVMHTHALNASTGFSNTLDKPELCCINVVKCAPGSALGLRVELEGNVRR